VSTRARESVPCDRIQAALSARIDGVRLDASVEQEVEGHLEDCPACGAFRTGALRVRAAVRIRPAEPVPDLVADIMGRVRAGGATRTRVDARALIAAALAGVLVGSLLVGGPWRRADQRVANAGVVAAIRAAAPTIDAYRASFAIVERGLSPEIAERHLTVDLAFRAPGRFRVDVRDVTDYPSAAWTPTDLTYIESPPAVFRVGPTGCPADLAPGICPPTRTVVRRLTPYSAAAPLAGDLILPLASLRTAQRFRVLGPGEVDGREALRVELPFERANPLLPFLRLGGAWRPFFPGDRVRVWLDAAGWFPLRITVTPTQSAARRAWELRFGRPIEPEGRTLLDVRMTSTSRSAPDASLFAIPGSTVSPIPIDRVRQEAGFTPAVPSAPGGLRLHGVVVAPASDLAASRTLLLYGRGLAYLRIGEYPSGADALAPALPGGQRIDLPGGGTGYLIPSDGLHGLRLALHPEGTDLVLETNLARAQLLAIAASLPVRGEPVAGGEVAG
jgi:hypothetical protein